MGRRSGGLKRSTSDAEYDKVMMREILPRLPAESLMKLKCVSKRWHGLITIAHLRLRRHSEAATGVLSVMLSSDTRPGRNNNRLFLLLHESKVVESWDINSVARTAFLGCRIQIVGISDGLVCLAQCNQHNSLNFVLWNPATREFRNLPQPASLGFNLLPPGTTYDYAPIAWGFGSDEEEFKVVVVMRIWYICKLMEGFPAHIYSESSDSWKQLGCNLKHYEFSGSKAVAVNGVFYWKTKLASSNCILSFDLRDEEFTEIDLPDYKKDDGSQIYYTNYYLTKWRGSLALLAKQKHGSYDDFWQLRYDLADKSAKWTRLFRLGPYFDFCGVWRDELLLEKHSSGLDYTMIRRYDGPFFRGDRTVGNGHIRKRGDPLFKIDVPYRLVGGVHYYTPSLVSVYPNGVQDQAETFSEETVRPASN